MPGLETAEDENKDERLNETQDENEIQDESVTTPDVMMRSQTSSFNQLRTQRQSDMKVVFFSGALRRLALRDFHPYPFHPT